MDTALFPVAEIFGPTMQGEGPNAGMMTYFIRMGGCDWRCTWCDSMHAVDPALVKKLPRYSAFEIYQNLLNHAAHSMGNIRRVVISGGNPVIHKLDELVEMLRNDNWYVDVETQGTIRNEWIRRAHTIVVSPKPPSSRMKTHMGVLEDFWEFATKDSFLIDRHVVLKIVSFDEQDFRWALDTAHELGVEEWWLSIGTVANEPLEQTLSRWEIHVNMAKHMLPKYAQRVHILPQLHVLLWGHQLGV